MLLGLGSKAQNPDFPELQYKIWHKNSKTINKIRIWNIDSLKIEYVKNGNLSDIRTDDVYLIESSEFYIIFDSLNHYIKNEYDIIINYNNEMITGRITKIDSNYITYIPYNKNKFITIKYTSYYLKNKFPEKVIIIRSYNTENKNTNYSSREKNKIIDKKSEKYKQLNKFCGLVTLNYIAFLLVLYVI